MNIAFMTGLNLKKPALKTPADLAVSSQGRDFGRAGNQDNGFVQILDKSRREIQSETDRNAGNRTGKTKPDSLTGNGTAEISEPQDLSSKENGSTDVNRANEVKSEQFNSQLLLELANLLRSIGTESGEAQTLQDSEVQTVYGQYGGQPQPLKAAEQKAYIMQLLQMAEKLTGEISGGVNNFDDVLQNLLKATKLEQTDGNSRIDTKFIADIVESLKNVLKGLKQETQTNAVTTPTLAVTAGGISSEKKSNEFQRIQTGSEIANVAGKAVEPGKQPLNMNSTETKGQTVLESTVKTGENHSGHNGSEHSGSDLFPKDAPGKNTHVPGVNEGVAAQPFKLETNLNGATGFEVQNPSGMEQSAENARITRNIFGQIAQKAKLMVAPGLTEMQIQLKPEVLGKLNLTITSENGMVTAKFNAESHTVKAIIEANLGSLKDALSQQGVKVDQLIVDVGTQSHQQGRNSHYHGSSNGKHNPVFVNAEEVENLFSRESFSGAVNTHYGSTVEFTA